MGRTNLVILCFGIFACVALSLMMGHVVKMKDKRDVHPAIFELHRVFGEQLERRPVLDIEMRGNRKVAVLFVVPKETVAGSRLARILGRYLVHFRGPEFQFDAMEVVMKSEDGSDVTHPVRVPGGMDVVDRRVVRRPRRRSDSSQKRKWSDPVKRAPKLAAPKSTPAKPQKHF